MCNEGGWKERRRIGTNLGERGRFLTLCCTDATPTVSWIIARKMLPSASNITRFMMQHLNLKIIFRQPQLQGNLRLSWNMAVYICRAGPCSANDQIKVTPPPLRSPGWRIMPSYSSSCAVFYKNLLTDIARAAEEIALPWENVPHGSLTIRRK